MKKISILFLALASVFSAYSAGSWNLQGNTYVVDTTFHTYIGPGTTQTSLRLSGAGNLRIFYTTTDLTNEYVDVRALKANDKVASVATVSSMALTHSTAERSYFAGVNADFFGNNIPIGTTIVDGEVYNTNNSGGWDAFGIDANKVPYLGVPMVSGSIVSANAGAGAISSFNTARYENNLILYSARAGATTGTNIYGTEVAVMPVAGEKFELGKSIKMKVSSAPVAGVGNMTVPTGGYVLSANGTATAYLNKMVAGEEITITTGVAFNNDVKSNITQVIGGRPIIVSNGIVLETQGAIDHLVGLHPRTAVGFTQDKKKLVMLVVDGRSGISPGVTSKVLGDIMISVGCSEAMNFDGGGSTTLYIKDMGIRNAPSDGKERAVTNGLYLSTSAPTDQSIAQIRFTYASKKLPKYGYYTPTFFGYNKYGVLISQNVEGVTLSAPAELGSIQNNGATLFCSGDGSHALTATYNGISTTIPTSITNGEISFRLANVVEDTYQGYKVEVISTVNEESMPCDNQALSWWTEDANIAKVDASTGEVVGVDNGVTTICGKINAFEGRLAVNVEKPTMRYMPIDPEMDLTSWTISQVGGKDIKATVLDNGMKLVYTGASGRAPNIKLAKKIKVWSIPDAIRLRINPGNAPINKVTIATNAGGGSNINTPFESTLEPNKINEILLNTADWCDAKDRGNYPINLVYLHFGMGTSTIDTEYTIEIPSIEAVYNNAPLSGVENIIEDKNNAMSISPNPVKAGEEIIITIPSILSKASVRLFNNTGQLIVEKNATVDNGKIQLSSVGLNAGTYIVTVDGYSSKVIIK